MDRVGEQVPEMIAMQDEEKSPAAVIEELKIETGVGEQVPDLIAVDDEEESPVGVIEQKQIPTIVVTDFDCKVVDEEAGNLLRPRSSTALPESNPAGARGNEDVPNRLAEIPRHVEPFQGYWDNFKKTLGVVVIFLILLSACYFLFYI